MIRAVRSELVKLRRRSVILGGAVLPLLSILATVLLFANAGTTPSFGDNAQFEPSLGQLGSTGGLTRGFTAATTLSSLLVLVAFIASMTSEWVSGTIRVLFVREPRRLRVIGGKATALLVMTVVALVAAFVASCATAYVMSAIVDVPTGQWLTSAGLSRSLGDLGRGIVSASCYGLVGLALGSLIRSTSIAVAVAFAWFFPLEHIVQNAWSGAGRWFPGLLFEAIARDGTTATSFDRALALGVGAAVILAGVAMVDLHHRDVTA